MFGHKTKNTIDSLIGMSTKIEGDLHFKGGLRIDGHIKGNVIADPAEASMLVISEQARVEGEVRVAHWSSMAKSSALFIRRNCLNCSPKPALLAMSITKRWKCLAGLWLPVCCCLFLCVCCFC